MSGARRHSGSVTRSLALASAALLVMPALAADQAMAPGNDAVDQDLLEFLGSVDTQSDDSSWFDFLRETDIGKLVKAKPKPSKPQEKT